MRVSLNWLKDYVDIEMPPAQLAELLTMSSLEVETLEPLGQSLEDIIVAKILSVNPHPQADRLFICGMDTGRGEVPVVCSAPNLGTGALVPMALPGAKLPGGIVVQESLIRGERSIGMLLAEDEMGLTDDHTGIMILPPELAIGEPLPAVLALEDWAIDISITPNRPDCASVVGVAREIAALTGQELKAPEIRFEEGSTLISGLTSVTIDDPEGCPRYAAGMIRGVVLKPSPFWLRHRLFVSGIRSINNVVDVTNYVMLEMGQPLHAFDFDRLRENRIVVKRARDGEIFSTLDGQTHTLNRETLMICDAERSVALAGIMGGLNSEIFAGSKNVLVESAYFDPVMIRRGSKGLGLSTEASYRFERGIDIEGVPWALRRSLMLLSHLAGGEIAKGLIDNYPRPYRKTSIDLRVDKTNRFLGTSLSRKTIAGYLKALQMDVQDVDHHLIRVTPPSFRVDILREVDLMEEVARLEGYDKIPITTPSIRPSEEGDIPELLLRDRSREIMAGLGFTEIITYSFISPDATEGTDGGEKGPLGSFVRLLNPLTTDQSVMRTSLVPGLLSAAKMNVLHGEKDLRLFEWGRVFIQRGADQLPYERPYLSGIMSGLTQRQEWYGEERKVDFYDIKGAVECLLKGLGLNGYAFEKMDVPPWYHPGLSCRISHSGDHLGDLGKISQGVIERYDIDAKDVYLVELDITTLTSKIPGERRFVPFGKFPAVFRDISLLVDKGVESAEILNVIENEGGELVESVSLYDLYDGEQIDPSEKALTFRICYRSREGTLDGKEVNRLHQRIVDRLEEKIGARLREG